MPAYPLAIVAIGCPHDEFWRLLVKTIGRPELAEDPRYHLTRDRLDRRAEVEGLVTDWTSARTKAEITEVLGGKIPFVNTFAALLTLPFWEWASRRWDKRIAYIAGMLFLSAVMITLIVVSPDWGLGLVFALAALAGVGVGAVHVLPWSMIPDAVEWDELASGERHEGIFYSLVTLFRKIASSISLPLVLLVLDWSGYVSNAAEQSPTAVRAIRIMIGPVPSVFLCAGIIFAIFYPLGRERHAQVRAELARRQSQGPVAD